MGHRTKASVSVIVPHYFVARAPHLVRMAADFHRQTARPLEFIVWNNEPAETLPDLSGTKIRVMQADRNYGPQARITAAEEAVGDFVLFMDNDTTAEPELVSNLLRWAAVYPGAIVTLEGRTMLPAPAPYTAWPKYRGKRLAHPRAITMSLGRGELVPRALIPRLTRHFPFGPPELMDDLWWSACAAWEGVSIFVVPTQRGISGLINLPEYGTGACAAVDYAAMRDDTIAAIRTREGYPRIWADA